MSEDRMPIPGLGFGRVYSCVFMAGRVPNLRPKLDDERGLNAVAREFPRSWAHLGVIVGTIRHLVPGPEVCAAIRA